MEIGSKTFYIDANRLHSVSSEDDNSSWEYQLNNGIKLPAGTQISMLNAFLNYNGITGGSIELTEDVSETINYCFYKPQGSQFTCTAQLKLDPNTGFDDPTNKDGVFTYDALNHRNTEDTPEIMPLLRISEGYTTNDLTQPVYFLKGQLPRFDLTANVSNPAHGFSINNCFPEIVYETYYEYSLEIVQDGVGWDGTLSINDAVINLTIDSAGSNYAVGDTLTFTGGGTPSFPAFGFVSQVSGSGAIEKVRIFQVGKGYTSAPTITISGSGTGGSVSPLMGSVVSTRSNNGGIQAKIGGYFTPSGGLYNFQPNSMLKSGFGYRYDDLLYPDLTEAVGSFYPTNHQIPGQNDCTPAIVKAKYTTALEIPVPGVIKLSNGEHIQYIKVQRLQDDEIVFIADDQTTYKPDALLNQNVTGGINADVIPSQGVDQTPDLGYRRFSYQINTTAAGTNYRGMPEVVYTPTLYHEENLNTDNTDYLEPLFLPVMTTNHTLEKVIYLGGCRDNLSASNYLAEAQLSIDGQSNSAVKLGIQPGYLNLIGGDPDSTATVDFGFTVVKNTHNDNQNRFVQPPLMRRAFQQKNGLKLGLSVVLLRWNTGTYNNLKHCSLIAQGLATGTGGEVRITTPYNNTPDYALAAEVITQGSNYQIGDRYLCDPGDGRDQSQMALIQVLEINDTGSALVAPAGVRNDPYGQTFSMTDGICSNLGNSILSQSLIKGRTDKLIMDAWFSDGNTYEQALLEDRQDQSFLPRNNYETAGGVGYDNMGGVGGTNEPIGYCTFDENGYLKPLVSTHTIVIKKGIYSVNEMASLISDQLTKSTSGKGFLNDSPFSFKVAAHEYEPALFTGKELRKAGRGVFIPMKQFNDLMQLYRDGTTLESYYLWENYHLIYYYAFIKSLFPLSKPPIHQFAGSYQVTNPGGSPSNFDMDSLTTFNVTSVYDQLNDGFLLGSSDFNISYDQDKSTYQLQFLHSPFKVSQYDKFGNQFSSPGTIGAMVKKTIKNPLIEGLKQQFLNQPGWTQSVGDLISFLESPITRDNGIMIHNFASNISTQQKTFTNNEYARFSDFYNSDSEAASAWKNSLFSRLGFTYEQLNTDAFKETVSYYNKSSIAATLYGITTNQSLDSSITTTISTLTADNIRETSAEGGSGSQLPYQQLFNMTLPNRPLVPIFSAALYIEGSGYTNTFNQSKEYKFFIGAFYSAATTIFIQTDGDSLTAGNLPILIKDGYFIISSNVIDGYRDSIKKNENIPMLGVVPKSSWQSQDFSAILSSEIVHVTTNEKVLNSIKIDIYNPDLTRPTLRPDSTVMLRITLPPPTPQEIKSLEKEEEKK